MKLFNKKLNNTNLNSIFNNIKNELKDDYKFYSSPFILFIYLFPFILILLIFTLNNFGFYPFKTKLREGNMNKFKDNEKNNDTDSKSKDKISKLEGLMIPKNQQGRN